MFKSSNCWLHSPTCANVFNFKVASVALEISSRKNISLSEYRNFFIIGKILSAVTFILPCSIIAGCIWMIITRTTKCIPNIFIKDILTSRNGTYMNIQDIMVT
jgi:hypothetical protein